MENEKKKSGKKKWIIIAVVVLLIAIIGSAGSEDTDPTVSPIDGTTESGQTASTEASTTASPSNRVNPGSSITGNRVKISFISCNSDFKNYSSYATLKSGHKVIEAAFEFENISDVDIFLNGFECYADGQKCDSFYSVDEYSNPTLESVSPGRKYSCKVYYEVPANATEIELEYEADTWSDEKYIFVVA